ncbi:MAG: hypothetical protein ACU84Q_07260 [Gammaproteobacteria bacterium]
MANVVRAINDETRCIDVRYREQAAKKLLPGAINIPVNAIKLQAPRLEMEYQDVVCGETPRKKTP